jgi:hypothetical protein
LFRNTNESANRPRLEDVSEATRKRLETLNQYDIELYEWVKALFAKQIEPLEPNFSREVRQFGALIHVVQRIGRHAPAKIRDAAGLADSLAELVAKVWHDMKLAGEMGPLLKIERDLTRAIEKGRGEWEDRRPLFRVAEYGLGRAAKEKLVRVVPGARKIF